MLTRISEIVDRIKTIVLWTVTLGALAAFISLLVREVREIRTIADPIAVPDSLRLRGYTPEVLSTVLIDRIAAMTAAPVARAERGTVAAGWGTADVVVPTLNISLNSTAGLFENLLGRPDIRVSGEIVSDSASGPTGYELSLRVSDVDGGWQTISAPAATGWSVDQPIDALVQPVAEALLLAIDPLSAASFAYVSSAERADDADALGDLDQRGQIVDAISRCLETCSSEDQVAAYVLWANLQARAAELRGDDALRREAVEKLEQARRIGPLKGDDHTKWGDLLIALCEEGAGFAQYELAELNHPDDFIVPYNRGRALAGLGRHTEAVAQFEISAEIDPSREWTFVAWGDALAALERWPEAERRYRQAIQLDGRIGPAFRGLGQAVAAQGGREAEAKRMTQRAQLLDPTGGTAAATATPPPSCPPAPPAG